MKTIGFSFDLHPPLFMIVFVILCGITCFILKKRKANMTVKQLFFVATTIFYSLSVVKLTLLPITISFDKTSYPDMPWKYYYQLIPFQTIISAWKQGNLLQVVGNIVLLLPLPILIGLLKKRSTGFFRTLTVVISVSLGIELTQLLINCLTGIPNKVADVDDFILNSIGGLVGWATIKLYFVLIREKKDQSFHLPNS
ncbi:VanZ family protein [Geobacillus stearothermophilus]|nr:VanZ like family protein [Geobacillus sp. 12AMOR1]WJQ14785.1 VanZ family protein [Geobacillus stearothermophilus]STO13285.1 VanZ like family [[Flavobacterium] thermophilum]